MQTRKLKVIVSCSGKFHAFSLAEQLNNHNILSTLFTSYSSIKNPKMIRFAKRIDNEQIPDNKINTNLWIAFGIKLFNNPFFWNNLFDKWVARKIKRSNATVFIGWSGMSMHSIKAAKQKGMIVILERGSSHIQFQNEILKEEYKKFGLNFQIDLKVIKKECIEYKEADYISIPSIFVKNSFIKKGVSENKLLKNNYGSIFKSVEKLQKKDNQFRILYLGTSKIRKGLIYFYEALDSLNISKEEYEVWFVGSVDSELDKTIKKFKRNNWIFHGMVIQQNLPKLISQCDVAVHPSLEEGLSMVIPQIMSCGVPVIATSNTGGADLINDGENGFIVSIKSPDEIKNKIEFLYTNPLALSDMKRMSKKRGDLSWEAYGIRYASTLKKIQNEQKS